MTRLLFGFLVLIWFSFPVYGQKVLQIEKFGKAKTQKMFVGETIFIQTKNNPDWFVGVIDDLRPDAQAIVFYDRIVPLKDITALKFRKKSVMNGIGRTFQWSWIIPVGYQGVFDLVNQTSGEELAEGWKGTGIIAGSSFLLGSLMRLIPPKKLKFGEGAKRRLRVLDLTFYPENSITNLPPLR